MVYGSRFKTLAYTIKWDDAALASKFYEKLKTRLKNAMVAMDKPKSLKKMINIAVRIDDRRHDRFVDKKILSKPIPKNKPQFKRDPMEFDVTEKKKVLKKTCYVCGKLGHLKRNCSKKPVEMSEEWIEMIEDPETARKINYENLSLTLYNVDQCRIYRSFKKTLNGIQKKKDIWEKAKHLKQTLFNGNTSHGGNDDQNWEIRNPNIDHTKHEKYDIDIIRKPNQKIFGQ